MSSTGANHSSRVVSDSYSEERRQYHSVRGFIDKTTLTFCIREDSDQHEQRYFFMEGA